MTEPTPTPETKPRRPRGPMTPETAFRNATRIAQTYPTVATLEAVVSASIDANDGMLGDESDRIESAQAALEEKRAALRELAKFVESLGVLPATDVSVVQAIVAGRVAAARPTKRPRATAADAAQE